MKLVRLLLAGLAALAAPFFHAAVQGQTPALGWTATVEGPSAGSDSVVVADSAAWTAGSNDSWLHTSASGTGSGNAIFTFDANSGPARTGTLTVASQTFTVTQAGAGYTAANAVLPLVSSSNPTGVAVDGAGNIYIADAPDNVIREWNASTRQIIVLVSSGLSNPYGVAVDGAGNVYIADTLNDAIKEWNASTQQVTTLVSSGLSHPYGLAVDHAGNVYIADTNNDAIKEWNATTQQVTTLVSSGLLLPAAVAVDRAGNVYIDDADNGAIKEWNASTQQVTTLDSGLNYPNGVWVDGAGNVYYPDTSHDAIKVWKASTQQAATLASSFSRAGSTFGVAVDGAGNVYISEPFYNEVLELPRAFVQTAIQETAGFGSDTIGILPGGGDLLDLLAPVSDQPWLVVDADGKFVFAQNAGSSRFAHLAVLGQTVTVTQQAAPFLLGVSSALEGPDAGSDSVALAVAPATGTWTAASNDNWLHVAAGSVNGVGSANVIFTCDANSGPTRTGTLTIAGQTFTVTQASAGYDAASALLTLFFSGAAFPDGVAVDGAGNIYFTDPDNGAIEVWNAATQRATALVSVGLLHPQGLAVDGGGNIYIADTGDNAIKIWSPSTHVLTSLVSSGLSFPGGVAVDGTGNVYIADTGDNAIKVWNASTQQVSILDGFGLMAPHGVAVDVVGNVYIADTGNSAIKKWSVSTGQVTTLISAGLNNPGSVAVDGAGNVYIADTGNNAIKEWSASTQQLTTLVSGLSSPEGVAVDGAGNVYLTDSNIEIEELPRAFADLSSLQETAAAGTDSITLLPVSENLQGEFAPTSSQSWLTIGTVSDGVIGFSFTKNLSNTGRSAQITLLGQAVTVNQAALPTPIAVPVTAYANSAAPITIDVLSLDSAPSGFPLSVTAVTHPSLGRVVINNDHTLTYTPRASLAAFAGMDVFSYTISDGYGTATSQVIVRNPYYPAKGTYQGLVSYAGGALDGEAAGSLSLTLTGTGGFTGSLKLGKASSAFTGVFVGGAATVTIKPAGASSPVTVTLSFDEAAANQVNASFTIGSQSYTASTGAREIYSQLTNPDPSAGYYTVQLPAPPAPSGTTATAAVTIGAKGKVTAVSVSTGGSGYVTPPRVVIAGATGKGAAVTATLSSGSVSGFIITAAGSGYPASGATVTIDPPAAGLPAGTGWAALTVSESGAATLAGKLGDGTGFSAGAMISAAGGVDRFALYLPLYAATKNAATPGAIGGVITFEPATGSDCDGTLSWRKPPQTTGALYQAGFTTSVAFDGARYTAPASGLPLQYSSAATPTGSVDFSGGNLTGSPTDRIAVSSKGAVTETGSISDKLKLSINAKTGLLTGGFSPASNAPAEAISGILDQKANIGAGLFLGPSQSGGIVLTPQ